MSSVCEATRWLCWAQCALSVWLTLTVWALSQSSACNSQCELCLWGDWMAVLWSTTWATLLLPPCLTDCKLQFHKAFQRQIVTIIASNHYHIINATEGNSKQLSQCMQVTQQNNKQTVQLKLIMCRAFKALCKYINALILQFNFHMSKSAPTPPVSANAIFAFEKKTFTCY